MSLYIFINPSSDHGHSPGMFFASLPQHPNRCEVSQKSHLTINQRWLKKRSERSPCSPW